ncbi:hypothetical protein C8F01DRAFT_1128485, partial [Mycena amicta]
MLRASWPLISSSFAPGARSTLEKPAIFPSAIRARGFVRNLAAKAASVDGRDDEPGSEFTPSYRFPSFPLILNQTTNETDSLPKPLYERLPKSAADIVAQVVASLPELLPEPDTDPESIFEDKENADYSGVVSALAPFTSTEALRALVAATNYDEALEVLDELLEVGVQIPFSHTYELAAIRAVKSEARTAAEVEEQIQVFKKWFSLTPTADPSRPRSLDRLMRHILLSPLNSLQLIVEFGLIAADKGFAPHIHDRVLGFVCTYGDPSRAMDFLEEIYCSWTDAFRRDAVGLVVRTFARAGQFDHAVELVPDPLETSFHLTPYTYNFLLLKMRASGDSRYVPHIDFVSQRKSEAFFRSRGPRLMRKDHLATSIQCLVNVGELDMAIDLFPHLRDAGSDLMMETFELIRPHLKRTTALPEKIFSTKPDQRYAVALKALAKAWRLKEALAILPAYHRNNTNHRTSGYNLLLNKLKAACNPMYNPSIELVGRLKEQATISARYLGKNWTSDLETSFSGVNLLDVRALRRGFRSPAPSQKPSVITIVRFMEDYLSSGHTRAISLLRKDALRTPSSASAYILAELLFHERRHQPIQVIRTFAAYFYIVGLPRDDLLLHLRVWTDPDASDVWVARPLAKLYPDPAHTAVVWRALLETVEHKSGLEDLLGSTPTSSVNRGVPLLGPTACAAFTPFLRRMCLAFGSERGLHVLRDMLRLGITPTIPSANGARNAVFSHRRSDAREQGKVDGASTARKGSLFPAVDPVLYVAIIRGFLGSSKIPEAKDVIRRMFERFGPSIRENEILQPLLVDVEKAQSRR